MKKSLTLGTLLLGCCLAVVAQTGQPPAASTPSTFPQDQTGQIPSNPATPSNPSALPPDTSATGQRSSDSTEPSSANATTAQGCLSQSSDGNFILADASGKQFQLHGDTSQLASYIGNEVRVDGTSMTGNATGASSMSSSTSSDPASASSSAAQFRVTEIHKLSDACAASK
jgi:hypothetical protein